MKTSRLPNKTRDEYCCAIPTHMLRFERKASPFRGEITNGAVCCLTAATREYRQPFVGYLPARSLSKRCFCTSATAAPGARGYSGPPFMARLDLGQLLAETQRAYPSALSG